MSGLRYGSVCSGIEAATVAWHVNVMRWIGTRIEFVESSLSARENAA